MSTLVAQTISNGTVSTSSANVIQGSAKAWVNFNGNVGGTIRKAYNVSSFTRTSTGTYTINFTNALSDANYVVSGTSGVLDGSRPSSMGIKDDTTPTTTSFIIQVNQHNTGNRDENYVCVAVFN